MWGAQGAVPAWPRKWSSERILLGVHHGADPAPTKQPPFFDGLQPVAYAAAAYGLVPIGLRPVRVCFDPRRSTLIYAVLVQGVVLWSVVEAWQARVPAIKKLAEDDTRFEDWAEKIIAAHSAVHLMGWLLVPTIWIEARRVAHLDNICQTLMDDFGHVLAGAAKPRKVLLGMVVVGVLLPLHEVMWMAFVEGSFAAATYAPVHAYINEAVCFGVAMPALCAARVQTFATNLAHALRRELLRGHLTASRVVTFRRTWMHLSDLNRRLIAAPVSLCVVMAMLVFSIVFHLYEGLEKVTSSKSESGLLEITLGLTYVLQLFFLCDVPDRSAEAIRQQFLDVLQMPHTHLVDSHTGEEFHQFLEIVWWNSSPTSVSNYFLLKRASFNAIIAVAITYSLVMLQFHLSINSPCRPMPMSNVSNS